ncbi:MAG: SDR family NAD(P)-dependent oxidoreductase [Planctomycetota bacterium]
MDSKLKNQVVLVTGAAGGIGQATARLLAAEGARVVVHYHTQREAGEALAASLPTPSLALGADLRDEAATEALFAAALAEFGRLDGLVVNAAIWVAEPAPLHGMTLGQWRMTMDTNLTSAFICCRAFLRHLAEAPREAASIVLVASTAALFGEAEHADYSASKAAMTYGLTRSLKNEIVRLAPRGRVNCVCPGWTDTPMASSGTSDPTAMARVFATMPLRKIATPEDVASAIVWLSSDALAGHVSGAILPLAGGMEGRLLHPPA